VAVDGVDPISGSVAARSKVALWTAPEHQAPPGEAFGGVGAPTFWADFGLHGQTGLLGQSRVKNVSQDELNRDRYECERDARMSAGSFGTGLVGELNAQEFMGRCFQAKGYHLQAVGEVPAPAPWVAPTPNETWIDGFPPDVYCNRQCMAREDTLKCYEDCRARFGQ
jgi:hypothetical protein